MPRRGVGRRKPKRRGAAPESGPRGWIRHPRFGFVVVVAVATVGGGALVRQVPRLLVRIPAFEINTVGVEGATYLTEDEARRAAGIVEGTNLWEPKDPWIRGLQSHPLVRSVSVRRMPPGRVVFQVAERAPVAFVATGALHPVDEAGVELPIDPSKSLVDLPLVTVVSTDSLELLGARVAARELGKISSLAPDVYAVISEAIYEDGEITLRLGDSLTRLRYLPPISELRLREAMAAMNDWVARFDRGPPREVDLRFHDQVVIRAGS